MNKNKKNGSCTSSISAKRRMLSMSSRAYYGFFVMAIATIALVENTELKYSQARTILPIFFCVLWLASAVWFARAVWQAAPDNFRAALWALGTVAGGPIIAMITSGLADLALDNLGEHSDNYQKQDNNLK